MLHALVFQTFLIFNPVHLSINDKDVLKIVFHFVAFIEANCLHIAIIILRKTLSGWERPEMHSKQNPPSCVKLKRKYWCFPGDYPITTEDLFYPYHLKAVKHRAL
ncbi:hypothetical protein AVEN_143123-1 [Araneus ventricosus]|uniref:Uncharacterized protein n=1 Tax=Araneus ventricosus TaxID=182803 RepID=A0A4Y1ZU79_ARAVE|nr:hypothetical protein AVEN_143123-1 [Araneus ventricosus]